MNINRQGHKRVGHLTGSNRPFQPPESVGNGTHLPACLKFANSRSWPPILSVSANIPKVAAFTTYQPNQGRMSGRHGLGLAAPEEGLIHKHRPSVEQREADAKAIPQALSAFQSSRSCPPDTITTAASRTPI